MKILGLVDCNSFFASCEKVFRPDWATRPLVVLSNNDGCVVARSPEAKALQIPMGAPYFQIKHLAQSAGVVICSSNYRLYGNMSFRVMKTLSQWTPDIEVYSIDESFLDLTGRFFGTGRNNNTRDYLTDETKKNLADLANEIVSTVVKWTGIPVAIGLGPTKTLAKAANRIAKNSSQKWCSLMEPDGRLEMLARLEIGDVWGVGRHLLPKFNRLGLRTAADLARVDPLWMRKNFSILQEQLVRELRGEECLELETDGLAHRQNIQVSRSFGTMLTSLDELTEAVSTFAARGAERLRRQQGAASALHVRIQTNRFREDLPQANPGMTVGFPLPTDSSFEIIATATKMLRHIYQPDFVYKRALIMLLDIVDKARDAAQPRLFEVHPDRPAARREKEERVLKAVDLINKTAGSGHLFFASEGVDPQWRPNSGFISPCYTTCWDDIPVVYAK